MPASPAGQPPELIKALVNELPARGKPFPKPARERWLEALRVNLDLVYGEDSEDQP